MVEDVCECERLWCLGERFCYYFWKLGVGIDVGKCLFGVGGGVVGVKLLGRFGCFGFK